MLQDMNDKDSKGYCLNLKGKAQRLKFIHKSNILCPQERSIHFLITMDEGVILDQQ